MAPPSHSLGGPAQIKILCIARPELPACVQHTQHCRDSLQPGRESSRCSQAWRQHSRGSEPPPGLRSWETKWHTQGGGRFQARAAVVSSTSKQTPHRPRSPPQMGAWKTQSRFQTTDCAEAPYHLLHADSTVTCLESPGSWNIRAGLPPSTERSQISAMK